MRLREDEVTGKVVVSDGAKRKGVIYLRRGRLVHVEGGQPADRLGDLLLEADVVSTTAIDQALERQKESGQLLGEALCELGLVDPETLSRVLCRQLQKRLADLLAGDPISVEVAPGEHRFAKNASSPDVSVEMLAVIFPAIRATCSGARLTRELAVFQGRRMRLDCVPMSALKAAGLLLPAISGLLKSLAGKGIVIEKSWLDDESPAACESKAAILALLYLEMLEVEDVAEGKDHDQADKEVVKTVHLHADLLPTLDTGELRIEPVPSASSGFRLVWMGHSTATRPDRTLKPYLAQVFEKARRLGVSVEMRFEAVSRLSSATVRAIAAAMEEARALGVSVTVVYDSQVRWQRLRFNALRFVVGNSGLLSMRSI